MRLFNGPAWPWLWGEKEVGIPGEVELLESPWSGGRNIDLYFGPVMVEMRVPNDPREDRGARVEAQMEEAVEQMRQEAAQRGANAIACPSIEIEPFGEITVIRAVGSAFALFPPRWDGTGGI
jgi:hypothetical protein